MNAIATMVSTKGSIRNAFLENVNKAGRLHAGGNDADTGESDGSRVFADHADRNMI